MERDSREAAFRYLRAFPSSGTPPGDRLASELAHGVVRHRARLDWIAGRLADRPVERIDGAVLDVLRLGLYQLLYTPSVPDYAAVSESVSLAKKVRPRAAGFVNWVLRRADAGLASLPRREDIADELERLSVLHSFPPWMVRRWLERFGTAETEELLRALNAYPGLAVRVNRLRTNRPGLKTRLEAGGFAAAEGRFSPDALLLSGTERVTGLEAFGGGLFYIQDESSQIPSLALGAGEGERILDACAGVGGKATHLAEIAGDACTVTAVDPDGRRLKLLKDNVRRLGLRSVSVLKGDILDEGFDPGGPFDRIIVDAPCSGLGTIRRHPELKWSKKEGDPERLSRLQLRLLQRAAEFLRPGGRLCYSTCTTEREENEEVVLRFLRERPAFRVAAPPPSAVERLEELLTPEGFLFVLPHRHGTDGAFAAVLEKAG